MGWFDWVWEQSNTVLFTIGETRFTAWTLVIVLVIAAVTLLVARGVSRLVMRLLTRRGGNQGSAYAVARITQYVIIVVGVLLGLDNIGLDLSALAAVGAVLSVGIGFGLQNITQNFVSGLILLLERPVSRGDFVVVGGIEGRVVEIAMRATQLVTRDGLGVLVPNSKLISDPVENQTAFGPNRLRVTVGVAYGSDTGLVRETLEEIGAKHGAVLDDPAPRAFFRNFGDSSLDFELCVWLAEPSPRPAVASDLRFAIDAAFRERGIQIPFPQRDLHLKSGLEPGLLKAG